MIKKLSKISLIAVLALALVLGSGAGTAQAALTFATATITGSTTASLLSTTTNAVTVDSGSTGTVNIGTGNNAKIIAIGTGTAGNTFNIGTDNTTADDINIGSVLDDVDITGASSFVAGTGDALTLTGHAASTWSTDAGELLITNTGALDADDIAITSTTLGDVTVTAGNLLTLATTDGNVAVTPGAVGNTIVIGKSDGTGAITLGNSTGAQAINIGIGGTAAKTITIGDAATTGTTTIKAGTGRIHLVGQLVSEGAVPVGAQTGAGTATIDPLSTDTMGSISSDNNAGATGLTVTFNATYTAAPFCVVTPTTHAIVFKASATATVLTINFTSQSAVTTFNYYCMKAE